MSIIPSQQLLFKQVPWLCPLPKPPSQSSRRPLPTEAASASAYSPPPLPPWGTPKGFGKIRPQVVVSSCVPLKQHREGSN